MTKFNWDMTTWDAKELARWVYAIGERSDRVISNAHASGDWSEYEADERLYAQLVAELKRRGLNAEGKPL